MIEVNLLRSREVKIAAGISVGTGLNQDSYSFLTSLCGYNPSSDNISGQFNGDTSCFDPRYKRSLSRAVA